MIKKMTIQLTEEQLIVTAYNDIRKQLATDKEIPCRVKNIKVINNCVFNGISMEIETI